VWSKCGVCCGQQCESKGEKRFLLFSLCPHARRVVHSKSTCCVASSTLGVSPNLTRLVHQEVREGIIFARRAPLATWPRGNYRKLKKTSLRASQELFIFPTALSTNFFGKLSYGFLELRIKLSTYPQVRLQKG